MKTQRILGILWMAVCCFLVVFWFTEHSYIFFMPHFSLKRLSLTSHFQIIASPVLLFGAVASFFLFCGARWARFSVGLIALSIAIIVLWAVLALGMRPVWDPYLAVFALLSAIVLLVPRRHSVA
jgi:hypothetical protein